MSGLRSKSQGGGTLGWRNLWNLAEDGDVKAMQNRVDQNDLLEHVNDLDTSGKTALHFACYANRLEVALFLLKCGASVAIKDCNGKTPIDIAMSRSYTQMADEIHAWIIQDCWRVHNYRRIMYAMRLATAEEESALYIQTWWRSVLGYREGQVRRDLVEGRLNEMRESSTASCHCGQVKLSFNISTHLFSAICHCQACQRIHSAPFVPLLALQKSPIFASDGKKSKDFADVITYTEKDSGAEHVTCAACSTTVCSRDPKHGGGHCTVPLSTVTHSPAPIVPTVHIHYKAGMTSCFDGLPKCSITNQKNLCPNNLHGRSKPQEQGRNCATETSGHYGDLLAAYQSEYQSEKSDVGRPSPPQNNTGSNRWKDEHHRVQCSCGDVKFEILGSPDFAANCHCSVCRTLHGASFVSLCGFAPRAVNFLAGGEESFRQKTTVYNCNGASMEDRYACKNCGTFVMTKMKHLHCRVVFLSNIVQADARFNPSCHIFYSSGLDNVADDLPKFVGFPPSLGGTDRVMLPNDIRSTYMLSLCGVRSVWGEAQGTVMLGVVSLLVLLTTSLWGETLNKEWSTMPWIAVRDMDGIRKQWHDLPTFLICEYTMYLGTLIALIHARRNAALDLWFAAWICGTANDVFFMFLPFCDNFWQAQATIMLTPRLPLYIVCMYVVLIYWSNTAARRYGFKHPIAEATLTGLLAALLYGVYDLNGPRFLWWTWHDTDAAIFERLGGAPIGSTMWILTYSALCNYLYRWCTRGGFNEVTDFAFRHENELRRCLSVRWIQSLKSLTRSFDRWQESRRSGATGWVILFVCCACTPMFMVLLGQFSVFSLDVPGKPGVRTLALACLVFTIVTLTCGVAAERQPSVRKASGNGSKGGGGGGAGDRIVGSLIVLYFVSHLWMMVAFDPATHVSTGVHQTWSPVCNSTSFDIMGLERQDYVCRGGPTKASRNDYVLGAGCGSGSKEGTVSPQEVMAERGGEELVEWYTVCGKSESVPDVARMLLLVVLGVGGYSKAFFLNDG